ncbi:MAG: hypothetical protein J6J60_04245 [Clostridia bacterium]|nr:hypothetical protein [Clostridia bacterium]
MEKCKIVFRLFEIIFSLAFIIIFIGVVFNKALPFIKLDPVYSILGFAFILVVWFVIYKKILKNANNWSLKKEIIIGIITFLVFIVLQFIAGIFLKVNIGWDFGVIFGNAKSFVLHGDRLVEGYYPNYFQYFPNNILLFVVYIVVIKFGYMTNIINLLSPEALLIVFNIGVVDIAVIILYMYLRRVFCKKQAYFGLILCLFFTPLILYSCIYYSDTLSLPFGILLLYLYSFINDSEKNKKNLLLFLLMGIVMFIGAKIKMTVLIIYIAILIDMFFRKKILVFLEFGMISISTFLIFNILFNNVIVNNSKFNFEVDEFGEIPYTHWIMMGIEDIDADNSDRNSIGGYSGIDYELTQSHKNTAEAEEFNKKEIINRINKYGFIGYTKYLFKKAVNAWGDGNYFASIKLDRDSQKRSELLRSIFVVNKDNFLYYLYFSQGVQISFLFLMILNSLKSIKNKQYDKSYIRISIFGVMLFLLLWENRSRYLVNYIPIFILQIIEFMDNCNFKDKKNNNKIELLNSRNK